MAILKNHKIKIGVGIIISSMIIFTVIFILKPSPATPPKFISISSITELEQALATAKQQQRPVLLDVYADWCTPCKALTQKTFPEHDVATILTSFTLLKADVTANTAKDIVLMQYLGVIGFPTLLFWDHQGFPQKQAQINGFIDADKFALHLIQQPLLPTISPQSQKK